MAGHRPNIISVSPVSTGGEIARAIFFLARDLRLQTPPPRVLSDLSASSALILGCLALCCLDTSTSITGSFLQRPPSMDLAKRHGFQDGAFFVAELLLEDGGNLWFEDWQRRATEVINFIICKLHNFPLPNFPNVH